MTDKPIVVLCQTIVGLLDQVKDKPAVPLSLITAACNLPPEFDVVILDQRNDHRFKSRLLEVLGRRPVMVGVTAMLGEQIKYALQVAEIVKKNSDVPVVWGGSQGGIMPEITVRHPYVDYVLQGDAEESLPALARALSGVAGYQASAVPGVWTLDSAGNPVNTSQRVKVDLNVQHEPLYDYFGSLVMYMPTRFGVPTIDVELSRGCPYKCNFCFNPYLHGCWRPLSIERSMQRLGWLHARFGVESFWFIDDEFFIDLDRARVIIEYLARNNYNWSIQGVTVRSVVDMDMDYLRMLKRSGCHQLNIGVESGSERMLRLINKPIRTDEVLRINKRLKEVGIIPSYYFVVGFPDEEPDDFRATIRLVWQLLEENREAKIMNVGTYQPYPNSVLETRCVELGYKPPEKLEDYIHFGVDYENLPWQVGDKDIIGANFTNYFIDHKIDDLEVPGWMRLGCSLYRPLARWRFSRSWFGLPLDIKLGRWLKEVVRG